MSPEPGEEVKPAAAPVEEGKHEAVGYNEPV